MNLETLKDYALDFAKAILAAVGAAVVAYFADLDIGAVLASGGATGALTALGPRDKQRRKRA